MAPRYRKNHSQFLDDIRRLDGSLNFYPPPLEFYLHIVDRLPCLSFESSHDYLSSVCPYYGAQ